MSKKKNKIPRLTDEQYNLYIAGLRNNETTNEAAPFFDDEGNLIVPEQFTSDDK